MCAASSLNQAKADLAATRAANLPRYPVQWLKLDDYVTKCALSTPFSRTRRLGARSTELTAPAGTVSRAKLVQRRFCRQGQLSAHWDNPQCTQPDATLNGYTIGPHYFQACDSVVDTQATPSHPPYQTRTRPARIRRCALKFRYGLRRWQPALCYREVPCARRQEHQRASGVASAGELPARNARK